MGPISVANAAAGHLCTLLTIRVTNFNHPFGLLRVFLFLGFIFGIFLPLHAAQDTLKIGDYENVVKRFRYENPDSAIFYARKGLELARRTYDLNGRARMLNQLGMIDDNEGRPEESRKKYLESLSLFTKSQDPKGMAAVTIRLGVVELRKGAYDRAISYFLQALKISTRSGNKHGIMEANITLGEGYMGQRDYVTALRYLKKAEDLERDLPFSGLSLNLFNNFGTIYKETRQYPLAISYLKKGIAKSEVPEMQGLNITLVNNLATVYARMGQKEESIRLQKTALAKARAIHNYLRELQTLTGLASSYGTQPEAIDYLKQALTLVRKKGDHKPETEILHKLAAVYKARGNLEAALNYKEQQLATADSFYYRKMSQKIENLQAAHELSISQAKVQELRLQNAHQQLEKVVIISVSVAVFLLLAILGFHYSRIRKFNARLNQANSDLTESNTVKDKLFSVLAHDLRSPMASIILLLEFINDDLLTEEEKKAMVNQLSVECKASLEMLNNLLKWGHMQIKGVHLNQEYISPAEIIGRTRTLLTSAAGKKDIRIKESMEEDLRVFSDPDHFEFIIRNLLSNAIKFTSQGGRVEITGKRCPNTGVTEFSVRDNGIGISSDRLQKVFSIHNVSTHGTNDEKGSSLGLLMCKEFIEANRGTIRVISEPGKGSEFIFTLPEKAAEKN